MRFTYLWALLCMPLVVGCDGCRRDPNAQQKEEDGAAFVGDFTTGSPDPFPSGGMLEGGNPPAGRAIKPGHWITAAVSIRSNNEDVRGRLVNQAYYGTVNFRTGQPGDDGLGEVATQTYRQASAQEASTVANVRPAVLPKGQMRRFDYRILAPIPAGGDRKNCSLKGQFVSPARAASVDIGPDPFVSMSAEEYFFVVLTNRPERFTRLRSADWVKPYRDQYDFRIGGANYRIVTPATSDLLTLSDTMLDWTNTSVVFWDDGMADILTPDQATALSDWVHFGGHLIVNGTDGAESIANGKLAELLAIKPTGNDELDIDAARTMLESWQVKTDRSTSKQIAVLESGPGRVMLRGDLADGASWVEGTGELIAQMPVGRGRIVQSSFDMTSDWMTAWQSFDSFVNAVLLARPPRQYAVNLGGGVGNGNISSGSIRQFTVGRDTIASEPAMNTQFRLASRDAVLPRLNHSRNDPSQAVAPEKEDTPARELVLGGDAYTKVDPVSGIGGWSDSSDIVQACREILRSESGIEIPKSSLVIRSLGYYLLVLVPLNFIVFRLMGRLEYAWLAVPVIAIGGAIWVARSAQLDIGFARSQTELAMLELQPGYQRGHLTRIDAIYNSLSSTYDIQFKTIDGCAVPIRGSAATDDGGTVFETSFDEGPKLAGVSVGSNQIRLIHAEQIVEVGGGLRLVGGDRLVNESDLEITDAYVVDKDDAGKMRFAVVGTISSGANVSLRYRDGDEVTVGDDTPMQTGALMRRMMLPGAIPPGTTRLVGRVDAAVGGMTITPSATQVAAQTVVLAHLKHSSFPKTSPDANLLSDLRTTPTTTDPLSRDEDLGDTQ